LTIAVIPLLLDEQQGDAGAPVAAVSPGVGGANAAEELSNAVGPGSSSVTVDAAAPVIELSVAPSSDSTLPTTVTIPATVPATTVQPTLTTADTRRRYTVEPGDSASGIARSHGVTLEAFLAENGMAASDVIVAGQEVILPVGANAPTTTAPTTTTTPPPLPTPPPIVTTTAPPTVIAPLTANPTGSSQEGEATFIRYDDARWGARTCAHLTIPKGITVTITNLDNGKSTTCVVRDRGPFGSPSRIIDLDSEVFAELADLSDGVIQVRITW
jgi:rare lipoprotein A